MSESQENVAIVRRLYAEGEGISASDLVAPDFELDLTAVYFDQPVLRGRDAVRRHSRATPWGSSLRFEPERFIEVDDQRVLVFIRGTSTGQASNVPVETLAAQEFTIRDGLVRRAKVYRSREEALRAVGLEE
jgi:ketosteroid isomerase-like protein